MNKDVVIQLLSNRIAQLEVDKAIVLAELSALRKEKEVENHGPSEAESATQSAKAY